MKKIAVIGAGGMGREVLDIIEACNQEKERYEVLGFIVDPQYGQKGTLINDAPILGGFDWLEKYHDDVYVVCGVGLSHQRYQLVQRARRLNCQFLNLIHPSVLLTRRIRFGVGAIIGAGSVLTNQIYIGNHVIVNIGCTVSHDTVLQDFVTLSPGVHIAGNVTLGDGCYVGIGASIIEKLKIGEWSIIGAGSTIIREVVSNTTVVGVPGRSIKSQQPGWHLLPDG
jgi:sugar O-acyltransferase (sialic acid O-acetyltransferase NeuD family)